MGWDVEDAGGVGPSRLGRPGVENVRSKSFILVRFR